MAEGGERDISDGVENVKFDDSGLLTVELFSTNNDVRLPLVPFSVPEGSDYDHLNSLVQGVFSKQNSQFVDQKFDFLLDGHLIRSTLKEITEEKQLAAEHVLKIEVILRVPSPQLEHELPHPDWVSAVILDGNCIISATYDGEIHVWPRDGQSQILSIKDHSAAVKALAFLPGTHQFVSASQDQSLMLWELDIDSKTCECIQILRGHERSVECCCVNRDATRVCSGGFDNLLKIWNTQNLENTNGESSETILGTKKRKLDGKNEGKVQTPMVTLGGHKEAITGVEWGSSAEEVITVSWDHTIRIWDLTLAGQKDTLTGGKALTCVCRQEDSGLLLTGSSDRHVRLWDPRSKEGSLVKQLYSSHANWVTAVKWNQANTHQFATSSFDRIVKLWDTRSNKAPLYDLAAHEDKALCCTFSTDYDVIASGGADNSVKIYKLK